EAHRRLAALPRADAAAADGNQGEGRPDRPHPVEPPDPAGSLTARHAPARFGGPRGPGYDPPVRELQHTWGGQTKTARLPRVLARAPRAADLHAWHEYGWRSEPDAAGLEHEHQELCALLAGAGAEVVQAGAEVVQAGAAPDGDPDAIYVFDP